MKALLLQLRDLFFLLMLLALVVQGMIPAGFMPGQDQSGGMQIVICTSKGYSKITVYDDSGVPDHSQKDKSSHSCPYAPVLTGIVPLDVHHLTAPAFSDAVTLPVVLAQMSVISQKDWASQGPPTIFMHV